MPIRNKIHLPHIRFAFSFSWKGTSAQHLITFPFLLLRISQAVVVVTVHGGCHKQVPCLTPYNGSPTQVCLSVAYDLGHGLPSSCVGWFIWFACLLRFVQNTVLWILCHNCPIFPSLISQQAVINTSLSKRSCWCLLLPTSPSIVIARSCMKLNLYSINWKYHCQVPELFSIFT